MGYLVLARIIFNCDLILKGLGCLLEKAEDATAIGSHLYRDK